MDEGEIPSETLPGWEIMTRGHLVDILDHKDLELHSRVRSLIILNLEAKIVSKCKICDYLVPCLLSTTTRVPLQSCENSVLLLGGGLLIK